ncbi:hypothetical protein MLD38_004534 [Melastoma candidum]|uniref:Uncharacterized protein n=1 Tax=Melastoma candidum TaxID=119954 RepID=A0ACB9S9A8_9MYRT|nr:hypothetical protein MLD38_004534 [Melastoma candidum]
MASSTPPPHCSITAPSKPYQKHPYPQNHRNGNRSGGHGHAQSGRKFAFAKPPSPGGVARATSPPAAAAAANPHKNPSFSLNPPARSSDLGADFSGRRSTRLVSKMHFRRPKSSGTDRHTAVAEEALHHAIQYGNDCVDLEDVLLSFEPKLCGSDDYNFLVREFGNRGDYVKAIQCFEFAVRREKRWTEQGKLTSAMISILGRLGKVDLARRVFDTAVKEGYGNTVYGFSAMISAYGRSGYCGEALKVFDSMRDSGLRPNLVTYNGVIDACAKGGMEYGKVLKIFDDMLRKGVQPDRITYNSLLAGCSRTGLWEAAKNLFSEMVKKGIDQDIFTYNTLIDALCKGGQMDLAREYMSEMPKKNIMPNVVTYSTMMDGFAKAGRFDASFELFSEMKFLGIDSDRVAYNTLITIYTKLGDFNVALDVCHDMEVAGIDKDVVTYNALLGGYGKLGKFDEVKRLFKEMKSQKISPNLLTYSTLIDVYSKGGLHVEAMDAFRQLKRAGLKIDVVLYSSLIDALCKNGLVESAVGLLLEMTEEGITPNVVTYNSLIDAFGRSVNGQSSLGCESIQFGSSQPLVIEKPSDRIGDDWDGSSGILKYFGRLASEKVVDRKKESRARREILCILGAFRKMHELQIKPNVVTFSAILNACSRCNSFEDASMLLEQLRVFDNQVYGVAHGLLMGCRGEVWVQALSLFDEVRQMDSSTVSAFYNALTDVLWHFDQRKGAELVVLEGKRRQVWENIWSNSTLDLHLMSSGAARAMVHAWLLNIRAIVHEGHELPKLLSILTGWGKHSKVMGDGTLRRAIEALLTGLGSPFKQAKCNLGRFVSPGNLVATWLKESGTLKVLVLRDVRSHPGSCDADLERTPSLQVLPLL